MANTQISDGEPMTTVKDVARSEPLAQRSANERTSSDHHSRIERLKMSALFAGLSSRECSEILAFARRKTYGRDEVLFFQGDINDCWMFIQTGSIKLTQHTSDGNEVILWINGCGEAVGVQSDTLDGALTCSARAMRKCEVLVWDRRVIPLILVRYPQIRRNITVILAARLRDLEERFREFAAESVPTRLALALLRLAKPIGIHGESGFALHLRRQELAQLTGTTLFTVSRILSKWTGEGLVVARREEISVRDPKLLIANRPPGKRACAARCSVVGTSRT